MNKLILLWLVGFGSLAMAQTNVPPNLSTNAPAAKVKAPTEITSDSADFDLNAHLATYRGHVVVVDPQVRLTCDWMVVNLPTNGVHLSHVLADTNVVVDFTDEKGEKYHVTSARAVYDYKVEGLVTNELVTFTGSPKVVTATSTIESEPMIWDRIKNRFSFIGVRMNSTEGLNNNTGTNGPARKLF